VSDLHEEIGVPLQESVTKVWTELKVWVYYP